MSQENVEVIHGLYLAPDADYVQVFRHDETWATTESAITPFFWPDFESAMPLFDSGMTHSGLDGLRRVWLEWMKPWTAYRIEIEETVDLGERVLLLTRNFGRGDGSTEEVSVAAAAVWSLRDGKISHADFYFDRAEALEAVGLEE